MKVHAAEFLLWEEQEKETVYKAFKAQENQYAIIPQYRIGIWRVLYQASDNPKEKQLYLDSITDAFFHGSDHLHALETLAKLKFPVDKLSDTFEGEILNAKQRDSHYIYGLWNLYYGERADRDEILARLMDVLEDSEQLDATKLAACYVLRYLKIPPRFQKRLISLDINSQTKKVQLQYTALLLMKAGDADVYDPLLKRLLKYEAEPDFYSTAILALSTSGNPAFHNLIDAYYKKLSDDKKEAYNPDQHATAAYSYLKFMRTRK